MKASDALNLIDDLKEIGTIEITANCKGVFYASFKVNFRGLGMVEITAVGETLKDVIDDLKEKVKEFANDADKISKGIKDAIYFNTDD